MRVQHNIAAMNSYRNYFNNTGAINKNLEKLSSGYKINRAGDDAAGLAISEKMRAQITGLEGAQKNAKDGIRLVQTAEGALTEVHSMLNRMFSLAEQSANGTYEGLDRGQLQKEVNQLRDEINRIADSANFNGLNLLDGSLSASGSAGSSKTVSADLAKLGVDVVANATTFKGVKGKYATGNLFVKNTDAAVASDTAFSVAKGDVFEFTVNYTDAEGKEQTSTLRLKTQASITADSVGKKAFVLLKEGSDDVDDGIEITMAATFANAGKIQANEMAKLVKAAIDKQPNADIRSAFKVDESAGKMTFEAKALGSEGAVLNDYTLRHIPKAADLVEDDRNNNTVTTTFLHDVSKTTNPLDAGKAYSLTNAKVWDNLGDAASTATKATKKLEDAIFEVNGEKFVFYKSSLTRENMEELNALGVTNYVNAGGSAVSSAAPTATAINAKAISQMAQKIATATGLSVVVGSITGSNVLTTLAKTSWEKGSAAYKWLIFKDGGTTSKGKAGGMTLQIGDTAAEYNQLKVDIGDIHVKALKIHDIDISKQDGAQAAMDKLKSAINDVSSIRGDLGAAQNRLEHTINNLSVMQENIQDAESNIRDTDVADEMMKYTKNSILVQSAQAMLAQANQQPQGVLQLLQ